MEMKKVWGIRHVRWWILKRRAERWAAAWIGSGVGLYMNRSDVEYLDAVWRGKI